MRLLLLFALLISSIAVAGAEVVVKVGDGSGAVGETATLSVEMIGAENVGSMDLVLTYDPEVLKVVKVDKGAMVKGLFSSNTDEAGIIGIGLVDSQGMSGDGEVARITFEVLKEGQCEVRIVDAKAYDVETHVDLSVKTENGVFKAEAGGTKAKSTPGFEFWIAAIAVAGGLMLRRRG